MDLGRKVGRKMLAMMMQNTIDPLGELILEATLVAGFYDGGSFTLSGFRDSDQSIPIGSLNPKTAETHRITALDYIGGIGNELRFYWDSPTPTISKMKINDTVYEGWTNPGGYQKTNTSNPFVNGNSYNIRVYR